MEREPFRIHPALESYVRRQSEEENRLLEESLLAEGCRDPLVVWKEENVLIDGHHRKRICDRHNIGYSVVYRSFGDMEEAKAWMDLNQLGRRNLDRADRDEMIRRLAARGVRHIEIAEKTGLSRTRVTEIANVGNRHEPQVNATTPAAEIERLQAELAAAEAKAREIEMLQRKIQTLETLVKAHKESDEILNDKFDEEKAERDRERKELVKALNEAQTKAKRSTAPEIVEKVVEKPVVREVVREVVPEAMQARLKDLEAQVRKTNANEQYLRNLEDRKVKLQNEIMTLKEQTTKDRIEATFEKTVTFIQTEKFLASQMLEFAERGELTIEQVDQVEGILGNVLAETNNALIALRKIRGEFRQGGGLRAL